MKILKRGKIADPAFCTAFSTYGCYILSMDKFYKPGEAADLLNITPGYLAQLVREGKVTAAKKTPGGQRRYSEADIIRIDKYLDGYREVEQGAIPVDENELIERDAQIQAEITALLPREKNAEPLVICIASDQGNLEASALSMNLGAYLAKLGLGASYTPQVCVIDGNMTRGEIALRFAGIQEPSIFHLAADLENENLDTVDYMIRRHDLMNLSILARPQYLEQTDRLKPESFLAVLNRVKENFDIIIIDTNNETSSVWNKVWFENSHMHLMITEPDIAKLKYSSDLLRSMIRSEQPLSTHAKVNVVTMQADQDHGFASLDYLIMQAFPYLPSAQRFYMNDHSENIRRASNAGSFLSTHPQAFAYREEISHLSRAILNG